MMNLKKYLHLKNVKRHVENNNDGLDMIYRFMSDYEKSLLQAHAATITFNDDIRDCSEIKERYQLSWNELRFMIRRFCTVK